MVWSLHKAQLIFPKHVRVFALLPARDDPAPSTCRALTTSSRLSFHKYHFAPSLLLQIAWSSRICHLHMETISSKNTISAQMQAADNFLWEQGLTGGTREGMTRAARRTATTCLLLVHWIRRLKPGCWNKPKCWKIPKLQISIGKSYLPEQKNKKTCQHFFQAKIHLLKKEPKMFLIALLCLGRGGRERFPHPPSPHLSQNSFSVHTSSIVKKEKKHKTWLLLY